MSTREIVKKIPVELREDIAEFFTAKGTARADAESLAQKLLNHIDSVKSEEVDG